MARLSQTIPLFTMTKFAGLPSLLAKIGHIKQISCFAPRMKWYAVKSYIRIYIKNIWEREHILSEIFEITI